MHPVAEQNIYGCHLSATTDASWDKRDAFVDMKSCKYDKCVNEMHVLWKYSYHISILLGAVPDV